MLYMQSNGDADPELLGKLDDSPVHDVWRTIGQTQAHHDRTQLLPGSMGVSPVNISHVHRRTACRGLTSCYGGEVVSSQPGDDPHRPAPPNGRDLGPLPPAHYVGWVGVR